jgi:outer membrane pore protein C
MKVKVLSLLVPALLVAGAANAAEIYNKDGNKLDLYGKVDGLHYFSDDKGRRRPDLHASWLQRRNSG